MIFKNRYEVNQHKPSIYEPNHNGKLTKSSLNCVELTQFGHDSSRGFLDVMSILTVYFGQAFFIFCLITGDLAFPELFYVLVPGAFFSLVSWLSITYTPTDVIFNKKQQEIYYAITPDEVVKLKWSEIEVECVQISGYIGQNNTLKQTSTWLKITGMNRYLNEMSPNSRKETVKISATDVEAAQGLWQFLSLYMEGSNSLNMDISEINTAHNQQDNQPKKKQLLRMFTELYTLPRDTLKDICATNKNKFWCIFFILLSPILYLMFLILFSWGLTAFLISWKRKPAFFPKDFINRCD